MNDKELDPDIMEDEDKMKSDQKGQQPKKIIIRKAKKLPKKENIITDEEDTKKVNGECVDESMHEKSNDEEAEVPTVQEVDSENKGLKRKSSTNSRENLSLNEEADKSEVVGEDSLKEDEESENSAKKRLLTEEHQDNVPDSLDPTQEESSVEPTQELVTTPVKPKITKAGKNKKKNLKNRKKGNAGGEDESQTESQAEYAQYLGLQPTMRFKCYRCGERGFQSMLALNMHQKDCGTMNKSNFLANLQQDTSSDPNMVTNFRITRKVYLCSACGTYYENWNLFLHMRDVHKKHICLFCLTMFTIADKLADHLKNTHNMKETTFETIEDFQNVYNGSCCLICCSCENMFTEKDSFTSHNCSRQESTGKCNLCNVKCGHYYTCPNNSQSRQLPASGGIIHLQPPSKPEKKTNQKPTKEKAAAKEKPAVPEKVEIWMGKKGKDVNPVASSDNDEDYDISDIANFCHIDIADESAEKEKLGEEESPEGDSESADKNQENSTSKEVKPVEDTPINRSEQRESENSDNKASDSEKLDNTEQTIDENSETTTADEQNTERSDVENKDGSPLKTDNDSEMTESPLKSKEALSDKQEDLVRENQTEDDTQINNTHHSSDQEHMDTETTCKDENIQPEENSLDPNPGKDAEESVNDCAQTLPTPIKTEEEPIANEITRDEHNVTDSTLVGASKNETTCETDDSDRSALVVDEKPKTTRNRRNRGRRTRGKENAISKNNSKQKTVKVNDTPQSITASDNQMSQFPQIPSENGQESYERNCQDSVPNQQPNVPEEIGDGIALAGEDVPAMALTLEDKLEDATPQSVVKECVRTSCLNCAYCSHATKIAVNGKHLALHLLAEHRYKPVKVNETSQDVITKLKSSLSNLETLFFNTDSYDSSDKTQNVPYDFMYECFQCRFVTKVHKELYVHNRKMHQKTVLLCVMCKSSFLSYSELLCHMCPGSYVPEDLNFRCCFCNLDMIPSAFRLMVHLRKKHHTCDTCLETADDQQKLSTHMWKHKLNHICYRCNISYRNKPDITKHLFWKHGTESILCKKCLQKKWPHVYHFCVPPTAFICEECNTSFNKAVSLKVHKRLHTNEFPYGCNDCDRRFISKILLHRHEESHRQPPPQDKSLINKTNNRDSTDELINVESIDEPSVEHSKDHSKDESKENESLQSANESRSKKKKKKDKDRKDKSVMDLCDLPPLNLSSESDSSDDDTKSDTAKETKHLDSTSIKTDCDTVKTSDIIEANSTDNLEENPTPAPVVDGVWDNFHSYKAELEKRESKDLSLPNILPTSSTFNQQTSPAVNKTSPVAEKPEEEPLGYVMMEHSYCLIPGKPKPSEEKGDNPEENKADETEKEDSSETPGSRRNHSSSIDHPYATLNSTGTGEAEADQAEPTKLEDPSKTPPQTIPTDSHSSKKKQKTPRKKKHNTTNSSSSSDSSSDTDSCKTNCSCSSCSSSDSSSSSSSDTDSSTSEGRRRTAERRERKREKSKHKHTKDESITVKELPPPPVEEEPIVDLPPEPIQLPIRESELETDESSTDEDFYDRYPQRHALEQMEKRKSEEEKRNLMMLATHAVTANNGTVSPPPPPVVEEPLAPISSPNKRKVKTKRRRKSQQSKKISKTPNEKQSQYRASSSVNFPMAASTPAQSHYLSQPSKMASPLRTPMIAFQAEANTGSGSEGGPSKRKRVRNKFYGYSSDEEEMETPKLGMKWRRVEPTPPPPTPSFSFQPMKPSLPPIPPQIIKRPRHSESSDSEQQSPNRFKRDSSLSSSSSESEPEPEPKLELPQQTEKSDNLYCYCQCPYDEVSEMIACDGQDCTIEWFHFECVGIMVPPKGKWYCPDCRKRRDMM